MYGTGVRLIEAARIKTKDLVLNNGQIKKRGDSDILRAEVAFNGFERPYPLQDESVIAALQKWVDWRLWACMIRML